MWLSEVILCLKFNPKTFPKEKFLNSFSFHIWIWNCVTQWKNEGKNEGSAFGFCIVGFHTHACAQEDFMSEARGNMLVNADSHAHFTLFLFPSSGTTPHPHLLTFSGLTELWDPQLSASVWVSTPLLEREHCLCLSWSTVSAWAEHCVCLSRSTVSVWAGALYIQR